MCVRLAISALASLLAIAGCGGGDDGGARGVAPPAPRADRPESRAPELDARLIAAARKGDEPGVERLLRRGAGVHARDEAGRTALAAAAYGNHLAAARRLVAAGADVNARDRTEQSPYLIATSEVGDDPRLLELMLRHGARVNDRDRYDGTGLIRAAERGHARIVRRLLRAGVDRDHVNRLGWTALHEAIVLGDGGRRHVDTVRALVAGRVDVNVPDGDGVRPLAHAEQRGYGDMARTLRAAGARR